MLNGLDASRSLGALPRADVATFEELWRGRLGVPVVVTGIADPWRSRRSWTRRRLLDELGAKDDREALSRALPHLLAREIAFPSIVEARAKRQANVWVAPDGYVSHLHFDLYENLLTVLGGEKDVLLFPPSETSRLYPHSALQHATYPSNSQVDLEHLDETRFPRVRKARFFQVTLTEDETLYIPPRFWHFVRSRGESVAVNVWFDRSDRTVVERARAVPLRLRLNNLLSRLQRG